MDLVTTVLPVIAPALAEGLNLPIPQRNNAAGVASNAADAVRIAGCSSRRRCSASSSAISRGPLGAIGRDMQPDPNAAEVVVRVGKSGFCHRHLGAQFRRILPAGG
ncbi:hypothetical protein [Candidatus Mycolicibacterium alkanivorans]|uniref:Uncharacterized protein n=1 Tax=Candidatus Mycolicibacterium alkanivorans TaxID=2954114 RepID=A0ABS9YUE8_9MYCO|nr:hypothetical protein [Candidatus Mycolicibacterium alkanivorans]MCI4674861.1 hypothetical protein [Candidatus Mycolicibacterium alkanivorans]